MEPLRIRIPDIHYCCVEDCLELTRDLLCEFCTELLYSGMGEEVSPTTLSCEPEVVHSTPLCRFLSG